jgi:hypothetical protein
MENSHDLRQRFSYWNSNLEAYHNLEVTITALHVGLYMELISTLQLLEQESESVHK